MSTTILNADLRDACDLASFSTLFGDLGLCVRYSLDTVGSNPFKSTHILPSGRYDRFGNPASTSL